MSVSGLISFRLYALGQSVAFILSLKTGGSPPCRSMTNEPLSGLVSSRLKAIQMNFEPQKLGQVIRMCTFCIAVFKIIFRDRKGSNREAPGLK